MKLLNAASIAALLLFCTPSQGQNLLINGSFELPVIPGGSATSRTNVPGWTSTEGIFEIWSNGFLATYAADGNQCVEILSSKPETTISQAVKTTVGTDYTLKLQHSPRPGAKSTFKVLIDTNLLATFNENGTSLTGHKWQTFSSTFTATTNLTTVNLHDMSPVASASGTHVDNVVLEEALSVPLRVGIRTSEVEVCWNTTQAKMYVVEYRSTSTNSPWKSLGATFIGTGNPMCVTDALPASDSTRFYRIVESQ